MNNSPLKYAWHLLLLALVPSLASGCTDECDNRPVEAQIDVRPAVDLVDQTRRVEVTLELNDGPPLTRLFPVADPSFVFEIGALDGLPRVLAVTAVALDDSGSKIGQGALTTEYQPNGCNFFSLSMRRQPAGGSDAGILDAKTDGSGRAGDGQPADAPADGGATADDGMDAAATVDAPSTFDAKPSDGGLDATRRDARR